MDHSSLLSVHSIYKSDVPSSDSSWKFHQLAAGQLRQGGWNGTEKAGGTARPLLTKSHLPGHSPPAGKAGRRVGPAL
jgi:hypothetical protein